MKNLVEIINEHFNNKYNYLKLLDIIYDRENMLCQITFLYPYQIEKIEDEDRSEIEKFIQEFFHINATIKIKYKKSFLDEKLIKADTIKFFIENKKALMPYIEESNISSTNHEQDVDVSIHLNQDILALIDEAELKNELKTFLSKLYIADFNIELKQTEDKLPDEIIAQDIQVSRAKVKRYKVEVIKKVVGDDIIPMPEFIGENKVPKVSVILAGLISNINQKKFILKKGKNAGKEKSLFTFNLRDSSGVIDCVYFCPKTHENALNALQDGDFLLLVGDLKVGLTNKLTYYIRKISYATMTKEVLSDVTSDNPLKNHKQIIFPETITNSTQTNLFEVKSSYDDYIMNNKFVVFDLETTGLDFETSEIIEIGAVKIENGEIKERFSSFAKPKFPIPLEAQKINNITNEMVEFAPKIEDVIIDFYNWSKDCIISGYNIVGFDMKFLTKVASKIGLNFDNEIIDTMIVVRQSKLRTTNYKLTTVAKALGIDLTDAHRAYNDAHATAKVLMELHKLKKNKNKS